VIDMLENGFWTGPIMDQHIHLDKNNLFLGAVDDFFIAGGTAINLVHKPDFNNLPKSLNDYQVAYNETLEMANEIREKYEISVNVILGPHPVTWEKQIIPLGIDRATELHIQAVDLALEHIKEKNAVCLGEVGRPHYPVNDKIWGFANELLLQIMQKAAENKVSIQLHVEDNGSKTYSDISRMCKISKLPKKRTIRHFAPADISSDFTQGISSTINVGKGCIKEIIETLPESESYWGMETDYLDDLNRPGAVLGPKTVPKRTQELSQTLWKSDYSDNKIIDLMLNIHSKWPNELYP
jgi:TatD-related deoxyribonuclease